MKESLERKLGLTIASLTRLNKGKSSLNWQVRTDDGETFLLKCVRLTKAANLQRQVDVAMAVGAKWAPRLFKGMSSWTTEHGILLAQEWRSGKSIHFERLTEEQAESFALAYRDFSEGLQRYKGALGETRLPELDRARQRVIHGDLNEDNVLFVNGEVSAIVDYEMVRLGLPTEDLVRGFIHRAKRLPFYAFVRRRRLVDNFLVVARAAGYSREDWRLAVAAYRQRKQSQRRKRHGRFVSYLESLFRDPVYDAFERAVELIASDFAPLRAKHQLERVGWGGVRRVCYKVGDTGLCVKFYKSAEIFAAQKRRRPRIERECAAKRFDLQRNNSAQEVRVYQRYLRTMPKELLAKLPTVVELVYDREWGYGILETYYTNPDGTAIIPYEFELARQTAVNRRIIYDQAKELLELLAANRAFFFEPGNFHNLIHADGTIETKIVDFEPTSKLFIKLERIWPWWRGWILRSKAKKYLRHIRETYDVK